MIQIDFLVHLDSEVLFTSVPSSKNLIIVTIAQFAKQHALGVRRKSTDFMSEF